MLPAARHLSPHLRSGCVRATGSCAAAERAHARRGKTSSCGPNSLRTPADFRPKNLAEESGRRIWPKNLAEDYVIARPFLPEAVDGDAGGLAAGM
jgi:hypothetical protein